MEEVADPGQHVGDQRELVGLVDALKNYRNSFYFKHALQQPKQTPRVVNLLVHRQVESALRQNFRVEFIFAATHDLPAHVLGKILQELDDLVSALVVLGKTTEPVGDNLVQTTRIRLFFINALIAIVSLWICRPIR